MVVCVKPVGADSEQGVPAILREMLGGEIYPLHRLDKNVGGVMVYARTKEMAAELSEVIREGGMVKEYLAAVHGVPAQSGELVDYLFKDSSKNKVFVVKRMRSGVKKARLFYRVLASENDRTLVQVRLYTGRSHQIRVQFSSRGFPLIGDRKYGSRAPEQEPMLYSCRVSFPLDGKTRIFTHLPDWAEDVMLLLPEQMEAHGGMEE